MAYQCNSCERTFASIAATNQHMDALDHHVYECYSCTRVFATPHARSQHMSALGHWGDNYECETCTATFSTRRAVNRHMDDEDHWSYPYDCETCQYSFRTATARDDHQEDEGHYKELHCSDCDRYFQNTNNLNQHLRSRIHQGANITCPFCQGLFTTASGLSHHLESSSCPNAPVINRNVIHENLRRRDPHGHITEKLIDWHDDSQAAQDWDPYSSWNGYFFECYICGREFRSAQAVQQHVTSPVHQAPLYHCPNVNGKCGGRKFPTLAAFFNHLESESCGYVKFKTVQDSIHSFISRGGQKALAF